MKDVVSVAQMRESDEQAIRSGTPAEELMMRAARGVFSAYPWRGRVAIVCGSGNNAGDGYALALLLRGAGISCRVLRLVDAASSTGLVYLEKCREVGIPIELLSAVPDFSGDAEIADCIFGTGFRGRADGFCARVIEAINRSGLPVISVDINSGMNGDSGLGDPTVRSTLTVSVGTPKVGHYLADAKDRVGKLCNVDIGIPIVGKPYRLLEMADVKAVFPHRLRNSHKGTYGYVGILGGSVRYAGAAKLANLGASALRAGCGVVSLGVPASVASSVSPYLLESTLAPLPDRNGCMTYDPASLDDFLAGKRAVAVGMGWGNSADYPAILTHILKRFGGSILLDADALNTLAGMDLNLLRSTSGRVILTPHPKEFERISGHSVAEILSDPVRTARSFASEYGVTLLLKGATTVVTDGEEVYLSDRGCAGMATAGSGDVLSGILVGLLGSQSPTAFTTACGAYLAGLAGELAEAEGNAVGMIASDTVRTIPLAISKIMTYRPENP
ncbi:MAG: NAD(P)H-hydrate dehydratase [Clostridia bacterium]|nr:NAD(P)H-hydrate dehydratase [Clostridia bacterium]